MEAEFQDFADAMNETQEVEVGVIELQEGVVNEIILSDWNDIDKDIGKEPLYLEAGEDLPVYVQSSGSAESQYVEEPLRSHVVEISMEIEDEPTQADLDMEHFQCTFSEKETSGNRILLRMDPSDLFSSDLGELVSTKQYLLDPDMARYGEEFRYKTEPYSIKDRNVHQLCGNGGHEVSNEDQVRNKILDKDDKSGKEPCSGSSSKYSSSGSYCSVQHLVCGGGENSGESPRKNELIETIHLKVKLYLCQPLEQSFSLKNKPKKHSEAVHLEKNQYECPQCEQRFTVRYSLKRHIQNVHLKRKQFECYHCSKGFCQKSDIRKHIETVHQQQKQSDCSTMMKSLV